MKIAEIINKTFHYLFILGLFDFGEKVFKGVHNQHIIFFIINLFCLDKQFVIGSCFFFVCHIYLFSKLIIARDAL